MDFFTLAILASIGIYLFKVREQRRNTRLLAEYLARFHLEKLMGSLIEGYLRALSEDSDERRQQIWTMLDTTEGRLVEQFQRFAKDFGQVPAEQTRVSTLALALPYLDRLFPQAHFDMRAAIQMHADGIASVRVHESQTDDERRQRAFMMTAELFLMQHTCHWFCKSRTVASMRLLARHKTAYEQVLASVSSGTRATYQKLTQS